MGQQVGDDQLGVAAIGTDVHLHPAAVLQRDDAPQLQGNGDPLVLADTAIIVGLEESQLAVLIQGIGLQIQPGRIDMGGGDLGAVRQGLLSDIGQHNGLAPIAEVHLVAGLHVHAPGEGLIALFFRQAEDFSGTEPLGLSLVQKRLVAVAIGVHCHLLRAVKAVIAVLSAGEQLFLQFLDFVRHW